MLQPKKTPTERRPRSRGAASRQLDPYCRRFDRASAAARATCAASLAWMIRVGLSPFIAAIDAYPFSPAARPRRASLTCSGEGLRLRGTSPWGSGVVDMVHLSLPHIPREEGRRPVPWWPVVVDVRESQCEARDAGSSVVTSDRAGCVARRQRSAFIVKVVQACLGRSPRRTASVRQGPTESGANGGGAWGRRARGQEKYGHDAQRYEQNGHNVSSC